MASSGLQPAFPRPVHCLPWQICSLEILRGHGEHGAERSPIWHEFGETIKFPGNYSRLCGMLSLTVRFAEYVDEVIAEYRASKARKGL